MSDERGREPGWQRLAHAYEELVAVAGVGGLVGLDQEVVEAWLVAVQRKQLGRRHQRETCDGTALAREPSLPGQPLPQEGVQ